MIGIFRRLTAHHPRTRARVRSRPLPSSLASALRAARIAAGMSRRQLAGRTGLSISSIKQYELGQRSPTRASVRRLVDALAIVEDRRHRCFLPTAAKLGLLEHARVLRTERRERRRLAKLAAGRIDGAARR